MKRIFRTANVLLVLLLAGCAGSPERPETQRQALFGLGEQAALRVMESTTLPQPPTDQVLLLAAPLVDGGLRVHQARFHESLTRALLGVSDGPQVLDWNDALSEDASDNQWRLESELSADGPELALSDRVLLPYRLRLALRRAGNDEVLWEETLSGAFDATAL
ncbi:hypothetical protein [Halomonas urumqiensis]|uniref:DUF3261 domain-containing protein n=1 Tax=Halomonas urumqiensis TaxID=1684789 RepID=A0A2N7UNZ2_9GAMM|nr:hypothetical protein [Halomonas urumqiensis]PMR82112.1 hypothetical protein C1H70_02615 [Halomonas urumqiensis]PTB02557.1 hypothetical protein C6V82_07850 [Halomonas urumqiensis]GHE21033.1 hypothetical protein GCM10017767_15540 [Halomonas urumqiensis]